MTTPHPKTHDPRKSSMSYRCTKCGAIWHRLKDIVGHTQQCKGKKQ